MHSFIIMGAALYIEMNSPQESMRGIAEQLASSGYVYFSCCSASANVSGKDRHTVFLT